MKKLSSDTMWIEKYLLPSAIAVIFIIFISTGKGLIWIWPIVAVYGAILYIQNKFKWADILGPGKHEVTVYLKSKLDKHSGNAGTVNL